MFISIYQINPVRDIDMIKFRDLDRLPAKYNGQPNAMLYDNVFNGDIEAATLNDVYEIFNIDHPEGYRGHSLSVSDVVWVRQSDTIKTGAYFVSSIGFRNVTFKSSLSYDAVFWDVPVGKGLTAEMLADLTVWMPKADAFFPVEAINTDMTVSALGFTTPRAAAYEAWIRREVLRIIENDEPASECTIETGVFPINIRLIRERRKNA